MLNSHPLLRRFTNRIKAGEHDLEWTTAKGDFFCRPRLAKVEIIWCASDWAREAKHYPMPRLKGKLARLVENRLLWRFWPVAENRALYFKSRHCIVDFGGPEGEVRINLEEEFHAPNRLLTSIQDLQAIVDSFGDRLDKVWFALNDVEENEERNKGWASVHLPLGTRGELTRLIQAIGTLLRYSNEGLWMGYSVRPHFLEEIVFGLLNTTCSLPLFSEKDYEPFLVYLRIYFPVESDILPVYNKYGRHMEELWPTIDMGSGAPTAHEKLEALLTWREFLRGKIPESEIDELLRPFQ